MKNKNIQSWHFQPLLKKNYEQNEAIISGDEILRTKFLWAKFEQDELEKEHQLMWY